jgi:hypothetical protein
MQDCFASLVCYGLPASDSASQSSPANHVVLSRFDDCFKLGKKIDEGPYELPDPEILRLRPEDDIAPPSTNHLEGATSAQPQYLPVPADGGREALTVFQRTNVMFSADLNINARLLKICQDLVKKSGGKVVDDVEDCDMFICQFRDGDNYVRAAQLGKHIGNLSWLYHLITHNQWTSPLQRLLHYPIPRKGIPGFEGAKIVVSNYGGDARLYLENLIWASGAEYTKTMKADNTHLITARNTSEKCEAARDWNITMVNHLWIEESYAKCEAQPVSVGKYIHFPPRTNLGEIIGQTFFNEAHLREKYYPGGEETLPTPAKRKRRVLEAAQDNIYPRGPAEGVVVDHQEDREFDVMRDDAEIPAEKPRRSKKQSNGKNENFSTPVRTRHVRAGKENDAPAVLSSGSRSAKNQALANLQRIAPDIALYEKEKKRASKDGHGPWGGKRAADQIDKERKPEQSSPDEQDEQDDDEEKVEDAKRPAKKQKRSLPSVEMRVVLTGFQRWVGDQQKEDQDRVRAFCLNFFF